MSRLAVAIILSLVIHAPALACRCHAPTMAQAVAHADAVVLGTVSTVRDLDAVRTVLTVAVERSWKRVASGTIEVDTGTTCRLAAREGERYILFLRRDAAGRYFTTHCMGDRPDPTAAEIDVVASLSATFVDAGCNTPKVIAAVT